MLCDVCDCLLPLPCKAMPQGHLVLARSPLGIVYFSSVCSSSPPSHVAPSCLVSPVFPVSLFWPSGVYFQQEDAHVKGNSKPHLLISILFA